MLAAHNKRLKLLWWLSHFMFINFLDFQLSWKWFFFPIPELGGLVLVKALHVWVAFGERKFVCSGKIDRQSFRSRFDSRGKLLNVIILARRGSLCDKTLKSSTRELFLAERIFRAFLFRMLWIRRGNASVCWSNSLAQRFPWRCVKRNRRKIFSCVSVPRVASTALLFR